MTESPALIVMLVFPVKAPKPMAIVEPLEPLLLELPLEQAARIRVASTAQVRSTLRKGESPFQRVHRTTGSARLC